jgi:hypothetical protein
MPDPTEGMRLDGLYLVQYHDHSTGETEDLETVEPWTFRDVGLLVKITDDYLVLANSVGQDRTGSRNFRYTCILRCSVSEVEEMKVGRKG